ncbi:MAG: conserved hypothetical rane protein [Chlamydiales bacterium]|jgi:uncharacterized protein (TIGR00159 family)|nr:conserved hypothetical rane protein [Chlamydiales bacterium]
MKDFLLLSGYLPIIAQAAFAEITRVSFYAFYQMLVPFVEIGIIAVVVYYLLLVFWNTRAMDLFLGLFAFLFSFTLFNLLNFPVLKKLMLYVVNVAGVALIVIFQPEIRLALSKLSLKGRKYRESTEFDLFAEELADAVYQMAEKRVGALFVLENQDSLDEFTTQAVPIGAQFSSELVQSIFMTTTPLHDGAIVLRGTQILSAATILPLASDTSQLSKSMGTRHRAALGITQLTDAVSLVVSEESGKVSIAREGMITRGIKPDRFKGILRSVFSPPPMEEKLKNQWMESLKKWIG